MNESDLVRREFGKPVAQSIDHRLRVVAQVDGVGEPADSTTKAPKDCQSAFVRRVKVSETHASILSWVALTSARGRTED